MLRCTWNGSTLNAPLQMGTNTLTCVPVNATTGTFSGNVTCPNLTVSGTLNYSAISPTFTTPTFNGSTKVTQTSATLPTAGTQIGFSTIFTPTVSLAYPITVTTPFNVTSFALPAIGVYLVTFKVLVNLNNADPSWEIDLLMGISSQYSGFDTAWVQQDNHFILRLIIILSLYRIRE